MTEDDGEALPLPALPDEIPLQIDSTTRLIATKGKTDRAGVVRYKMRYDDGKPVSCVGVQYGHGEIGLIFNSRIGGQVAFDFKLSERQD